MAAYKPGVERPRVHAESLALSWRLAAARVVDGIDWSAGFSDDAGHSRAIDGMLLAWWRGTAAPAVDAEATADMRLWHALASGSGAGEVERVLEEVRSPARREWGADGGSLLPQAGMALEVWTETDLAALHALWWLARVHGRADWARMADACAAWHVEHVQPDNATGHPWGIHVFALRGASDAGARLYAETLLHNCQVSLGQPDRLSAVILLDAARAVGAA